MVWNQQRILRELRRLHKEGRDISYNGLARRVQSLVSAASYHFKSYRRAVEQAGIDYREVLRRPKWTKNRIVHLIKSAFKKSQPLHWSAVTQRRDSLGKAAFASLQRRLFGRWEHALKAAGLDPRKISQYQRWDRNSIVAALRLRHRGKKPMSSGLVQKKEPGLHAAAVRHFGGYEQSLVAAKLNPTQLRLRKSWDRKKVIAALRLSDRAGAGVSASTVRLHSPSLYGAAVRLFGSFTKARAAAKIEFRRKKKRLS